MVRWCHLQLMPGAGNPGIWDFSGACKVKQMCHENQIFECNTGFYTWKPKQPFFFNSWLFQLDGEPDLYKREMMEMVGNHQTSIKSSRQLQLDHE